MSCERHSRRSGGCRESILYNVFEDEPWASRSVLFMQEDYILTQDAMIRNPKAPAKCEVYTWRMRMRETSECERVGNYARDREICRESARDIDAM